MGWELVGVCSFMLIGHWWEEKPNSDAALKAFLTTRTGDIGLLTGVIMTFFVVQRATGVGSFNIVALNSAASNPKVGHTLILWCAAALMLAIVGKSGQFPLHTWLPDAMAGPTPVSALIHAATMVVAGVYLGARVYPVFFHGFSIGDGGINPMAAIGGITVIIGAALAFVQDDIKKVLAYSTISQLGYMVMALGVGAWTAAVFHLFTHAFFKADLFLGVGSVSHSGSHHSFDMKKDMGGLKKYMPQTYKTFVIGTLALAGIFPLAGFWSKDEILVNAGHNDYKLFLVVGLIGAFMTAAYMTRCVYLTFHGEYRGAHAPHEDLEVEGVEHDPDDTPVSMAHDAEVHAPHESNRLITGPLWVLSFFAVFAGFLNFPHLEQVREVVPAPLPGRLRRRSCTRSRSTRSSRRSRCWSRALASGSRGPTTRASCRRGSANATRWPARASASSSTSTTSTTCTRQVIVGRHQGPDRGRRRTGSTRTSSTTSSTTPARARRPLGRFTYDYLDQKGVDGLVNGLATLTGDSGGEVRKIQTGRLQFYALMLVAAVVSSPAPSGSSPRQGESARCIPGSTPGR